jgi:hypothetical protein
VAYGKTLWSEHQWAYGACITGRDSSKILAQNVPGNQSRVAAFSLNENVVLICQPINIISQSLRLKSHKQIECISLHLFCPTMSTKNKIKTINQQQYV